MAGLFGAASALGVAPLEAQDWPSRALQIEKALDSPARKTRLTAVRQLGELSPRVATKGLIKALGDDDPEIRLIAAKTAVFFDCRTCQAPVLPWLASQDGAERLAALEVLGVYMQERFVPEVAPLLGDSSAAVRGSAALALSRARGEGGRTAASVALLRALDDSDHVVRADAARALGQVGGPGAALTLAAHLQDPEAVVRQQLAVALGVLGDRSVAQALLVALSDPDDGVVAAAASSLGYLAADHAAIGLVAVAEQVPFVDSGQRAAQALGRVGDEKAHEALFSLLEKPDRKRFVEGVLEKGGPDVDRFVLRCIERAVGDLLLSCVRVGVARSVDDAALFRAMKEGRLSAEQVLGVLTGHPSKRATVLALEELSTDRPRPSKEALGFLLASANLPSEAEAPLEEALRGAGHFSPQEVAGILGSLSRVVPPGRDVAGARDYLEASDEQVRAAAAGLMVVRGAHGDELEDLLFRSKSEIRQATLEALGLSASQAQLEQVAGLLVDRVEGSRKALASVFDEAPIRADPKLGRALLRVFRESRLSDRDAVLPALVRALDAKGIVDLLGESRHSDRLRVAQLSWYVPSASDAARRLIGDENAWVVALAVVGLGLHGTEADVDAVTRLAGPEPTQPTFVRAAALSALSALVTRGITSAPAQPDHAACDSPHLGLRVAALRLWSRAGQACGASDLEDLVRLDPDARIRAAAARILAEGSKESRALDRCAVYEPRVEVAAACATAFGPSGRETAAEKEHAGPQLPYVVRSLGRAGSGARLANVPVAVRLVVEPRGEGAAPRWIQVTAVSDQRGHLFLPPGDSLLLDDAWAY